MKTFFTVCSLVVAFLVVLGGSASAQNSHPGIRVVETKAKTIVYDIKVSGLEAPSHATYLDEQIITKYMVVSSNTDFETRICRVEILAGENVEDLGDVFKHAGFSIAKSFDQ